MIIFPSRLIHNLCIWTVALKNPETDLYMSLNWVVSTPDSYLEGPDFDLRPQTVYVYS
jgi:hypothetical protein